MSLSSGNQTEPGAFLLPRRRLGQVMVIGAVFLVAAGIRLYKSDQPPLDYQPTRQYRSALIARAYYLRTLDSASESEKRIAACNAAKLPLHEPPVLEYVVSCVYRLVGGEHFWVSRSFSSLFWVIGGLFLYGICRRTISSDAALVSATFYLFTPFGVRASRSFQPDPLMMMLLLASL